MNYNIQWLGVSFGKLLVGYNSGFSIHSLTVEGRPQSMRAFLSVTLCNEMLIYYMNWSACFIGISTTEKSRITTREKLSSFFTCVWDSQSAACTSLAVSSGFSVLVARRHGVSLHVFNSLSHSFAALNREISSWTLKEKFHISARPCIIHFLTSLVVQSFSKTPVIKANSRSTWPELHCVIFLILWLSQDD